MAVLSPAGVPSSRNRNIIWVDAIADINAPKVTELTSALASLDFSCWLNADWDGPGAEQSKDTDERWCGNKFETMGDVEYSMAELVYVVDPQATDQQGTNRAKVMLANGKRGFMVMRRGKDMNATPAAGDKVDIYTVQLGVSMPASTASNEPLKNRQAVAVVGEVKLDVTVVA